MSYLDFDFPHTSFYTSDLRELINAYRNLRQEVDEFVSINALKYADPIQWNITTQYEKNTIVIDPSTGTAYISVQAVPLGISLSNQNYWTPVFDLGTLVNRGNQNLTLRVEGDGVIYSTFASNAGDWIVWDGLLYEALTDIPINTIYNTNLNLSRLTVEDAVKRLQSNIDAEAIAREAADKQLQSNVDAEAIAREAADKQLQSNIDAEAIAREAADKQLQSNIDAEVAARIAGDNNLQSAIDSILLSVNYADVKAFGAVGDGTTDDTEAFVNAIASGKPVFIPSGTYYLPVGLTITTSVTMIGSGTGKTILKGNSSAVMLNFNGSAYNYVGRFTIRECTIGIEMHDNAAWSTFEDINITQCTSKGVYCHGNYFPTPTTDVIQVHFNRVKYLADTSSNVMGMHFYCVGDIYVDNCVIQVNTAVGSTGIEIDTGCSAVYMKGTNCLGTYQAMRIVNATQPSGSDGTRPIPPHNIFMVDCLADSSTYGLVIADAFDVTVVDSWLAGAQQTGCQIQNGSYDLAFIGCRIHSNGANGIWVVDSNSHDIRIIGCRIDGNSFSNLQLNGYDFVITDNIIKTSQYGIILTSGMDVVIIDSNIFTSDVTTPIFENTNVTNLSKIGNYPPSINTPSDGDVRYNGTELQYYNDGSWITIVNN